MMVDSEHVILAVLVIFYFALCISVLMTTGHTGKFLYYLGAAILTIGVYIT